MVIKNKLSLFDLSIEQFKTDRSIWDDKVSLVCAPYLLDFYEKQFRTVITTSNINKIRLV